MQLPSFLPFLIPIFRSLRLTPRRREKYAKEKYYPSYRYPTVMSGIFQLLRSGNIIRLSVSTCRRKDRTDHKCQLFENIHSCGKNIFTEKTLRLSAPSSPGTIHVQLRRRFLSFLFLLWDQSGIGLDYLGNIVDYGISVYIYW